MIFQKNDKIASYTVTFPHKQGAYAETYRVKDSSGKTRFLKLIRLNKLHHSQIDATGQILEVEICKQLAHPNLCQVIDTGNVIVKGCSCSYVVSEFVSGETLSQKLVRNEPISVYDIRTIAKSVLAALQYLHNLPRPIIHNEITIQNILLNLVGDLSQLKLIDFGSARYLNQVPAKPDLSERNVFYLAPERFAGVCSVQSDLYAVGVMMYHLLWKRLPWFTDLSGLQEERKIECVLSARNKELYFPATEIFELDDNLRNTIIKAMQYDSDDRFQTAEEFIQAIDGAIQVETQSTKRRNLSDTPSAPQANKPMTIPIGEGFAAVAGMEQLKEQLREEVIYPLHHPEEAKQYGITIANGMLLYGPPGCGKTFFAKHLAEEVGFNFVCQTPADLMSKYVNETQENIATLFQKAAENAPTLIFIDEINTLVPNRKNNQLHEMSQHAVEEMLAQMDRTGEKQVFVIGATNLPEDIDPTMLRAGRLEKKFYVGPPDHEARRTLFKMYLEKRSTVLDFGIDYDQLAVLTENYISADIKMIIDDAARKAWKTKSKITMALLQETIQHTQPSLSTAQLQQYEAVHLRLTNSQQQITPRPRIGFE